MAEPVVKSYFPSQIASDLEKITPEYGLKVAKAIEHEWFKRDSGTNRYYNNQNTFHRRRLYARGEQSIQKYKDELSINGDLSYLNLDWKPVPIIPKFVDIVVNGMSDRVFDIKAFSQDSISIDKRTKHMQSILADMEMRDVNDAIMQQLGINLYKNDPKSLPETTEELDVYMQMSYKQSIEVAAEKAINTILEGNRYELTRRRLIYDLVTVGMACVKNNYSNAQGITVEYVDPADLIYSYTDSPYFEDIYYIGEIKTVPINELKKKFPDLTNEDLEEITKQGIQNTDFYHRTMDETNNIDSNSVQILYFNYKTYMNEVYKVKKTATGASKALIKNDTFNPPKEGLEGDFEKLSRSIEVLYEGALVLGTNTLLQWELAKNMLRPKSDQTRVKMNYSLVAPRMYKGRIESLVSRIEGFADMIQLTHLKLQQVLSRMVPDGVYLDADGLAEIDLGNGTNYNPQEALNMFFQTGSVIGRSFTSTGDMNPGKMPIQELSSSGGNNKLASLIQTYNYYLQMIRDVTGLNEARDGSMPDKNALVGVQKLAAANSNTATRHILQSGLFLTAETAECISLRVSDVLEYSPAKEAFIQSIGAHTVGVLEELKNLHLHDFGIFIELAPDEEEKQLLENNIQMALAQNSIDLEDAIDVRDVKNIKLANQLLKIRRVKKQQRDQAAQQANIQAQAQANAQAQQVAAQAEIQKQQVLQQMQAQMKQLEAQLDGQKLDKEAAVKKELMQLEFQMNMQLKSMEVEALKNKENNKEDRKDKRVDKQASRQSELIDQRKNNTAPKNFESSGNDVLGGFNLGTFEPR